MSRDSSDGLLLGNIEVGGRSNGFLYFHSPCFDGIVSAVLASDFLETQRRWRIERFCAVDYGAKATWLSRQLHEPCCVVDFIYHPQATFWADHHSTTFLTPEARTDFELRGSSNTVLYDQRFGSCAKLLWDRLEGSFGYRNPRYAELAEWADRIDGARYATVAEAILGDAPALRIRASLGFRREPDYFEHLVKEMRSKTLEEVADSSHVIEGSRKVQARIMAGLKRFKASAWLEDDGIAVFDVNGTGTTVSRYAPYYIYPAARYSVGIIRSEFGAKITAMRNPWSEFHSVPLGTIIERFGGGGHERVAGLLLPPERAGEARSILNELISAIRAADIISEPVGRTA
jgi:hypothetical protein